MTTDRPQPTEPLALKSNEGLGAASEALNPCPFCGGADLHIAGGILQQVYCERCDAYGPARKHPHAASAWNTRWRSDDGA
jgi:Lar family restriction alleviation protein